MFHLQTKERKCERERNTQKSVGGSDWRLASWEGTSSSSFPHTLGIISSFLLPTGCRRQAQVSATHASAFLCIFLQTQTDRSNFFFFLRETQVRTRLVERQPSRPFERDPPRPKSATSPLFLVNRTDWTFRKRLSFHLEIASLLEKRERTLCESSCEARTWYCARFTIFSPFSSTDTVDLPDILSLPLLPSTARRPSRLSSAPAVNQERRKRSDPNFFVRLKNSLRENTRFQFVANKTSMTIGRWKTYL